MELEQFCKTKQFYLSQKVQDLLKPAINYRIPVMLRGSAGTGKTELTKIIAEFLNAEYIFYQCTLGTNEEDLIYKLQVSEDTKSGIKLLMGPLPEALLKSKKQKVVLVLDEFDKTRPSCDALLLDFLQNFRVSVRIKSEKVITGNIENLWVFITSNDERGFSEPLMRRVISINMDFLPSEKVAEILKQKGINEKIIPLLVQLYQDTIDAELQKPATIQELIILGKAIELLGDNADWTSLIRSYVIKDDNDWQEYINFLRNGRQKYIEYDEDDEYYEDDSDSSDDVTEYYEETESSEIRKTEDFKPKMPKIKVKHKTRVDISDFIKDEKDKIVGFMAEYNEKEYSQIIRDFEPEPTDDPSILGNFKVVRENNKTWIIREEPLKINEICKLEVYKTNIKVRVKTSLEKAKFCVIDTLYMVNDITELLSEFKCIYYSRDLLRFKLNDRDEIDFILRRKYNYGSYSKWNIELIYDGINRNISGKLDDVIKILLKQNPWFKASLEFTYKVLDYKKENGKITKYNELERSDAREEFKKNDLPEITNYIEHTRQEISKKYGIDTVRLMDDIHIEISYKWSCTNYIIHREETKNIERRLICK